MASYFDASEQADKDLLHSDVRDHAELELVATDVEYQVIEHFRQEKEYDETSLMPANPQDAIETEIRLAGYDVDADDADVDEHLKKALRYTIAYVISYCLRNYDNERNVNSKKRGNRSKSYSGSIPTKEEWPDDWSYRYLDTFDTTDIVYGL